MKSVCVVLLIVAAAIAAPSAKKPFSSMTFDNYWSLDEIYDYLGELEAEFPDITEVEHMGTSEGGIQIRGLRVTNEEHLGRETLPVIFVTAGVSARDWISTMAAVNLIHELVEHYEDFRNIIDNVEWFIIPVANPDGYNFSRTEGNRDWVKNRAVLPNSNCIGVNVERNFNFNWGLGQGLSSDDPCSDNYHGPVGDSEEETKTIQFAIDITQRIQRAYVTIRAGSENAHSMVAYPFSSNNELFLPNFAERMSVGNIVTDAIWQQTGARYRTSSEANVNGFISGTSGDYAAGQDNIPLVYTIFAPRGVSNGWDVPEDQIGRIVNEIFTGIAAIANYVEGMPLPENQV